MFNSIFIFQLEYELKEYIGNKQTQQELLQLKLSMNVNFSDCIKFIRIRENKNRRNTKIFLINTSYLVFLKKTVDDKKTILKQLYVICSSLKTEDIMQQMYSDISEKWRDECSPIKRMSQPLNLKEIGLQKIDRCTATQFKVVQYMTQTKDHLKKLYVDPESFCYNRSEGIMAFDQTRVSLGQGEEKKAPENYINGNVISLGNYSLIATQGPKHNTLNNFWRMIEEHKVTGIFMLCERTQKGKEKCYMYWPIKDQCLKIGNYEITLMETSKEKHYRVRKFLLKNTENNYVKQVQQYQFMGWPDGDRPLDKHRKSLIKLLQIMINYLMKNEMVIVHCSAGVGRTGTFIALSQIKMHISKNEEFSIFEIVRTIREQRWGMVYTESQYEYLYDFAENESNRHFQPEKFQELDNESQSDD